MHISNLNKIMQDSISMGIQAQEQFSNVDVMNLFCTTSMDFWQDLSSLLSQGSVPGKDNILDKDDRRFKADEWHGDNFELLRKSYLLYASHAYKFLENLPGTDNQSLEQFKFFMEQLINAFSPANFLLTNPEAWKITNDTNGANLIRGFENFFNDFMRNDGILNQKMTDVSAFNIGDNIATTAGDVIFKNDLIELIHYKPSGDKTYKTPLLIVPPWINKYYVMDLSPENSFVKWILDQGMSVCLISWLNPSAKNSENSFEKYIKDGVIAATEVVQKVFDVKKVSALGYCNGGTLLSMTAAHFAAKRRNPFANLTYLACLMDFTDPGEIGVFINNNWYKNIVKSMDTKGYLDGRMLALAFNLLRANDLYWSYYVNNYLLDKKPRPFDLLYWNSDATNLSKNMYSFYLKELYLENNLIKPGTIDILGTKLDLTKIKTPAYFLSTDKDHIAPWKSTYSGAQAYSGPVEFVLGGSGHIAGVINPPAKNKYGYKVNDIKDTADKWLESSKENSGSWWNHWIDWITKQSGQQIDAIQPGNNSNFPTLAPAPGEYVKKSYLKGDYFQE